VLFSALPVTIKQLADPEPLLTTAPCANSGGQSWYDKSDSLICVKAWAGKVKTQEQKTNKQEINISLSDSLSECDRIKHKVNLQKVYKIFIFQLPKIPYFLMREWNLILQ
jgi:hypothetical protein